MIHKLDKKITNELSPQTILTRTECPVRTLKKEITFPAFLKNRQSVNVSRLWSSGVIYPTAAATVGSVLLRSQTRPNQRAFGEMIIDLITSSTAATSGPK